MVNQLFQGSKVIVTKGFNQFSACNNTQYQIGAINRVQGTYMALLLKDGKCCGAVPSANLKTA
jgi:hypothetical protein